MPTYTVTAVKNESGRPFLYREGQFVGYLAGLGVPDGAKVTLSWEDPEPERADLDCVPPEAFQYATPAELLAAADDAQEWPTRWSTNIHAWAKAVTEQLESLRSNLGTVCGRVDVIESCAGKTADYEWVCDLVNKFASRLRPIEKALGLDAEQTSQGHYPDETQLATNFRNITNAANHNAGLIRGILARLETLESCAEVGTACEVRGLRERLEQTEERLMSGINDLHRRVKALEGQP